MVHPSPKSPKLTKVESGAESGADFIYRKQTSFEAGTIELQ